MLKRTLFLLAAIALTGFALPSGADAQWTLYIGGGGSFPTSDFGDVAKTGWMVTGGAIVDVGPPGLGIGIEGFYGQNNFDDEGASSTDASTKPYGAMAIVDYGFQTDGSVTPYLFGGLGLMVVKVSVGDASDSESEFGYQLGGGVSFDVSPTVSIYGEGRYMGATGDADIKYFGALAGLAFHFGN